MSQADDSWTAGALPAAAIARFQDQSQLDFEIGFFDSILCRNRDNVDVLRCQGELLSHKGLYEMALEVDRRLITLVPDDPVAHYNLACSLALVGMRSEALEALRDAFNLGYDDWEHLAEDTDLDILRDDPNFQSLVREMAQRSSAAF